MPQPGSFGPAWRGSLRELAHVVYHIRRSKASGRLSLRNTERLSVAHLYFRDGRLVQIVGNRGDNRAILLELKGWTYAAARFDRGELPRVAELGEEYEQLLAEVLQALHSYGLVAMPEKTGLVAMPEKTNIIEGELTATPVVNQLITPWEWRVLMEATRRISFAVSHLVGPQEAFNVLLDILADCSAAFPAFRSLKIATSGYLEVTDRSQLDRMPREDLLEGFTALFATCQYFCVPLIGEQNAHRLLVQALQDVGPALVSLGVFQLDTRLLSSKDR